MICGKTGLGYDLSKASPVLQSSFLSIVVDVDSNVIGMIFRSKNGCETAGSAGNDTEEEEVPGRELPSQGQGGCDYEVQGGCEVQGSIQDKKGLVNVFNLSLCRLL